LTAEARAAASHRLPATPAVPPVYYPVRFADVAGALMGHRGPAIRGTFVATGTEALKTALQSLGEVERLEPGCGVVVPDFICNNVAAAVMAAGMTPVYCPLSPRSWFYDLEPLRSAVASGARVATVVSYFGHPPDLSGSALESAKAALKPCLVVADAAQAFGPDLATWLWADADLTIFSFGPGKSMPLNWGGLVTARSQAHAQWLDDRPRSRGAMASTLNLLAAYAQSLLLNPRIWGLLPLVGNARRAPALNRAGRPLAWPATTYLTLALSRLGAEIDDRRRLAAAAAAALRAVPSVHLPSARCIERGVALRLPVVFTDPDAAQSVRAALRVERIVKGPNQWDDYAHASENAAAISGRLVTLPTFPAAQGALDRAVGVILRCCA